MLRVLLGLSVALGVCLLLGGKVRAEKADDATALSNDLKEILLAYHNYGDKNKGSAPAKAADLAPFLEKRALGRLEDKSVVFVYGVTIKDMTEGTSNTVLAYEKDAPEKGGLVAYGDGSVKKLTADAFKKATVAKPSKK
jgi:hypothetical protein